MSDEPICSPSTRGANWLICVRGVGRQRTRFHRPCKPDGYTLARHMSVYAETGEEYVKLIRGMIQRDTLRHADTAKLSPGPRILFRRVDQK